MSQKLVKFYYGAFSDHVSINGEELSLGHLQAGFVYVDAEILLRELNERLNLGLTIESVDADE
jgi:hypothetical protein